MGSRRRLVTLVASLLACALAPSLASAGDRPCRAPTEITRLAQPLIRTAARLAKHEPVTIVAIGSSSTFGAGASSAAASYPSRLAVELKVIFPMDSITVVNRGVNGEEVADMLKRFTDGVIKLKPDLVLWQLGTNSVLRDNPLGPTSPLILDGIRQLKAIGADVVMIDPQYAPRVIAKPDAEGMVRLIAATAKQGNIDLIQRFTMMRWWHDHEHMDFGEFVSPDNLHMNDWGYACLAKQISASISEAATRNLASASARSVLPARATP
jgi:acyl-CoA thioesterase I